MNPVQKLCLALSLWHLTTAGAQGTPQPPSSSASPTLTFSLDRAGVPSVKYTIRIDEVSGRGIYHVESPAPAAGDTSADFPVAVDEATLKKLLAAIPVVEGGRCETHSKKIAQTGVKTLQYRRDGKVFECTFNYSDEDRVNTAASLYEAIGETMGFGDRLAAKLRFDRLGLDTEIDGLTNALTEGRAAEVGNILPVLEKIQKDDRVMDRVHRKVARVLAAAGLSPAQSVSGGDADPNVTSTPELRER